MEYTDRSTVGYTAPMQKEDRRRRALLGYLQAEGLDASAFAVRAGLSKNALYPFLKGERSGMSDKTWDKLAAAAGIPAAVLKGEIHSVSENKSEFYDNLRKIASDRIPVYGSASGGVGSLALDIPVDEIESPAALKSTKGAYAVYVSGDSMKPRYRQGDILFIHPYKAPARGDDVVYQTLEGEAFIKEYCGEHEGRYTFRQYNPEREFEVMKIQIDRLHKVVGVWRG